jgi:hypothetical protein
MKLIYLFCILVLIACAAVDVRPYGIVEGKVSIGPLCGFTMDPNSENPCGLTNEELDRIYGEYTVILSSEHGYTAPLKRKLDRTGVFLFEVEGGRYNVYLESDIQNALAFSAKTSVEKTVKVSSKQRVFVELNVNTGRP